MLERFIQTGRGNEDRLSDLGIFQEFGETTAEEGSIGGECGRQRLTPS
jgi:hypothetical protein